MKDFLPVLKDNTESEFVKIGLSIADNQLFPQPAGPPSGLLADRPPFPTGGKTNEQHADRLRPPGCPKKSAVLLFPGKKLTIDSGARRHLLCGHPARLEADRPAPIGEPRIIGNIKIQAGKAVDLPSLLLASDRVGSPSLAFIGIHSVTLW